MKDATRLHVSTAIHGLMYAADSIDQALLGEKRSLDAQKSTHDGPFIMALGRMAEIADGGSIADITAARADMLFLWPLLYHLGGGFYSSMWDILARAHERLADVITAREATILLGAHGHWLDLDARLGHLHPFEEREGALHTYDATFLGNDVTFLAEPLRALSYARYEVEARKHSLDTVLKTTSSLPLERAHGSEPTA